MESGSNNSSCVTETYFAVDFIDDQTKEKYSTAMTSAEIEEVSSGNYDLSCLNDKYILLFCRSRKI